MLRKIEPVTNVDRCAPRFLSIRKRIFCGAITDSELRLNPAWWRRRHLRETWREPVDQRSGRSVLSSVSCSTLRLSGFGPFGRKRVRVFQFVLNRPVAVWLGSLYWLRRHPVLCARCGYW